MKLPAFLKFSEKPANLPAHAPRVWPIVEVVSVVTLVSKPLILTDIVLVWGAERIFNVPLGIGASVATVLSLALLIPFWPTLVRCYWDTQLLYIEEHRASAEQRAKKQEARRLAARGA
jgi:hypothetical protein